MDHHDVFLVIGGSGFVGRHIVQLLLDRRDVVSVFDVVQRYHDVPFYLGDISDQSSVVSALKKSGATCIIHTASPPAGLKDAALYWKVNVDGTKAVIAAAVATGVRKLVFTSSAGVIFNGSDIIDIDERLPPPDVPFDAYNESKAKAEQAVLAANGKSGLLTVSLRPAGIFGPGDRQLMSGLYSVYERGQTHFQIGDNTNLFDWTYVTNVARAHLLAADKLTSPPPPPTENGRHAKSDADASALTEAEQALISHPLPSIDLTTGQHRIPTSQARPLGPFVTFPPNGEKIAEAFARPPSPHAATGPVIRSRYDQLTEPAIARAKAAAAAANDSVSSPLSVAGQAFFITNGEPCYFWDVPRLVWAHLDPVFPGKRNPARKPFVLSKSVGLAAASAAEWVGWFIGKAPTFTRFNVSYSCAKRWHNIEKARRVLGYEPEVGLEEGIKRMVEWWKTEHAAGNHKQAH